MSEAEVEVNAVAVSGEYEKLSGEELSIEVDVRLLKVKFRDLGFDRPPLARMVAIWALTFVVTHAFIAASWFATSWWLALLASLLSSPSTLMLHTLAHTASHNGLTGSHRLDRWLLLATMPFVGALSARYWIRSHVQIHHPAPNVLEHDDDCDLRPLFALNDADIEDAPPWFRAWFRFQLIWLLLLLPLNGIGMQRQALAYWWTQRSDKRDRGFWILDGLGIALHVVVRFVLPIVALHVSPGRVFAAWGVWIVASGMGIFVILAPGHYPHAAKVLAASERRAASYWLRQTATTINFRTGFFGALLCSGLEYQIEHHLFPGYNHLFYPKMAPLVRAFCNKHGLPYTQLGWGESIIECLRTFAAPKPVVRDVKTLATPKTLAAPASLTDRRSA